MIENIIERMAKNSFQLKAWTMALVAVIGGLAAKGTEKRFILIAFVPIICFWILDTYYLRLERQYRFLYRFITDKKDSEIDFKMGLSQVNNLSVKDSKSLSALNCFFSSTELIFYMPLTIALIVIMVVLKIF